jgi:hypothetical protein
LGHGVLKLAILQMAGTANRKTSQFDPKDWTGNGGLQYQLNAD